MMGTCIINSMILRLQLAAELPGGSVKMQISGLSHRATDSVSLGESLRICITSKFVGDAAVILGTML